MKTAIRREIEMKDSGVEWIGYIPKDWKITKLGNLGKIQTGNTPDKSNSKYYSNENGVLWVKAENLGTIYPIEETSEYITEAGTGLARLFDKNTVFVCCIASIGKCGYSNKKCSCNQQINGISFDKLFWKYGLYMTIAQEEEYLVSASGNVVKILNTNKQKMIKCPVPSLSEQQAIADYLDKTCSKIDEIIAEAKASIDEYKELKQSVIFEAVTKGLDKNVEMKDSGIEWIGETPDSWNIRMLNQYVSQVKCKNSDLSETNLLSLSYGKIKRKDINSNGGLLPESFDNYNIVDENDIVLRLTDLQNDHKSLRVGLVTERGIITSAYVTIRPKKINAAYLALLLHAFDYKKGFYGMGAGIRQGLTFDGVKSLKIVVPSDSEQDDIVKYVMKMTDKCDSLITEKESLINDLEAYKKSLIYEVVTGKRRVV